MPGNIETSKPKHFQSKTTSAKSYQKALKDPTKSNRHSNTRQDHTQPQTYAYDSLTTPPTFQSTFTPQANETYTMSSNSNSSSSYTYTSSTSTSTSGSGSDSYSHSQTTRAGYDDRTGGHAERITQETGKPTLVESTEVPARGQGAGRIADVSDEEQAERDRLYEERIEEEYAKREGGA